MTAITIRLMGTEAAAIRALVADNPALNPHRAGRVAMRLGLRLLGQQPDALDFELNQIKQEADVRRQTRREVGQ